MESIETAILAIGSNQEKGRALERGVGAVWSELGYRKLKFNVHATGEEIDVEGTHVVSGEILKGQCKAHRGKIDTGPVRQFFGDVEKERGRSDRVIGVFVSLCGFSGTAERWHEELSEKQRNYFKLFDGAQFLSQLEEARLICSVRSLTERLGELTRLEVTRLTLLLTERGPFWMVTLGDAKKAAAYHAFLTGLATPPRREDVEYLEARVTVADKTRRISFAGRESVIGLLLREGECPISEVASKTGQSAEDVEAVTTSLAAEGLIRIDDGRASLRREIDAVSAIARLCLGSEMQLDFMKSTFYRDCLQAVLLPFVEGKYLMKFESDERDAVRKILSVSPLALKRILTGDAELFRNTEAEIARLNFQGERAARQRRTSRVMLMDRLIHDLMSDHIENNVTPLFAHYDIIVTKTGIELKLGKRRESFLIANSSWFTQVATAGEPINAGQFVFADGPGPILEGADAKMAINEWSAALESYEFIITNWPDSEAADAARNNKALCLLALDCIDEAIDILQPLLEHPSLGPYALSNLARCSAKKGNRIEATQLLQRLNAAVGDSPQARLAHKEVEQLLTEAERPSS
jgi:tetratricopeptide (TPR) repeat protein